MYVKSGRSSRYNLRRRRHPEDTIFITSFFEINPPKTNKPFTDGRTPIKFDLDNT